MRSLQHALEFLLFRLIQAVVILLPPAWTRRFGAFVGKGLGRTIGWRWRTACDNLRGAFPQATEQTITELASGAFESVGITLFELLRFPWLSEADLRQRVVVEGLEDLERSLESGRGVIVLTAHYGSWELVPQATALALGRPGHILVRGLANPFIDRVVDRLRRRFGNQTVPSTLAVRELYRVLKAGGWILMAADQSAPPESRTIRFFGRMTPVFEGPAVLAIRTGATIVFGVARRMPDGRYQLAFEPIPTEDLLGSEEEKLTKLIERCLAVTESAIRVDPSQWMWMHRRWKHAIPDQVP